MRYYMDAALHPGSRILDGLPMRRRGCDQRRLTAASAIVNPGNHQIAAVPVSYSAVEWDTWTRLAVFWLAKSTVALWASRAAITDRWERPGVPGCCTTVRDHGVRLGADPCHR